MRLLRRADDPVLVVDVADPAEHPEVVQAPEIQWPHVRVRNVGMTKAKVTRPATGAWVDAYVAGPRFPGRKFEMLWRGRPTKTRLCDIRRDMPEFIPVARLNNSPEDEIQPNACYFTDEQFLFHSVRDVILLPERYMLRTFLHYNALKKPLVTQFLLEIAQDGAKVTVRLTKTGSDSVNAEETT